LIVVPTSYIPLDPVFVFPFPRLVGFILGIDLVELPGVFTGCVLKTIAFDLAVEIAADYSLEVSLIIVKHLVPCIVLLQDFFWSNEDYSY
jgi:hydrogenase/urease accessory protein HupE